MSTLPEKANIIIIGAGIVGNSVVYHLAQEGWTDIVQVDKGPLPNPGGSTGHASNFIFPVDHSKGITELTLDSMNQYKELGVFTESGGVELARSSKRMEELKRRMDSAKSWGIENTKLITPGEVKELVPYVDTDVILGGFWSPGVGVVEAVFPRNLEPVAGGIGAEKGAPAGDALVVVEAAHPGISGHGFPGTVRRDGVDPTEEECRTERQCDADHWVSDAVALRRHHRLIHDSAPALFVSVVLGGSDRAKLQRETLAPSLDDAANSAL